MCRREYFIQWVISRKTAELRCWESQLNFRWFKHSLTFFQKKRNSFVPFTLVGWIGFFYGARHRFYTEQQTLVLSLMNWYVISFDVIDFHFTKKNWTFTLFICIFLPRDCVLGNNRQYTVFNYLLTDYMRLIKTSLTSIPDICS